MKKISYRSPKHITIKKEPHIGNKKRNNRRKIYLTVCILALIIIAVLYGMFVINKDNTSDVKESPLEVGLQSKGDNIQGNEDEIKVEDIEIESQIEEIFSQMSLEDKICQLMITTPEALVEIGQVTQAEEVSKRKIRQYPVSGLIFSDKNFEAIVQLQKVINSMLVYSKYPLLVLVEESSRERVENTYTALDEVNINMVYTDAGVSLWENQELTEVSDLEIKHGVSVNDINKELFETADILVVDKMFQSVFNKLYDAITDETIALSVIDEKVKNILAYKIVHKIQ